MESTLNQIYVFAGALFGGVVIGVLYDLCFAMQTEFKFRTIGWIVTSVLFWAAALLVHFSNMLYIDGARLRIFPILACIIGFVAYRFSLGVWVRTALTATFRCLYNIKCRIGANHQRRKRKRLARTESEGQQ